MKMLDKNSNKIINMLSQHGFEAFYVGGCVRTIVHNESHNDNIQIKDFDIVTNASYDDMMKIFKNIENRGESFNVAIVKIDDQEYEVASYRGESYPEGGSTRPNEVFKVDTLEEDLLRRDFKMNGLVVNNKGVIIDHVGGLDDIRNKQISTIGNPNKRFSEDPLRILRAVRFVAQLGYSIEEKTLIGIVSNMSLLSSIPHSRIEGEFSKIIRSKHAKKALLVLRGIFLESREIKFKNSILDIEASLMPSVFSLPLVDFCEVIEKIDNTFETLEFFYTLYENFDASLVERELTNMQITNKEIINDVKILIENKDIVKCHTKENLLKLVKCIKNHNGRPDLIKYLNVYSKVDKIEFKELKNAMKKPLFLNELPYNGLDVINEAKSLGYNIQGKMIKKVLELGRDKALLEDIYDLKNILSLSLKESRMS